MDYASQDNILGISFGEDDIEVIEWNFNKIDKSRIRTSKEEVLEQVLSGLESVNQSLERILSTEFLKLVLEK